MDWFEEQSFANMVHFYKWHLQHILKYKRFHESVSQTEKVRLARYGVVYFRKVHLDYEVRLTKRTKKVMGVKD